MGVPLIHQRRGVGMNEVRFLLNGAPRAEDRVPPTMTVLDWLRTVAGLTGTKDRPPTSFDDRIVPGRMRDMLSEQLTSGVRPE